jgi:protein-L-isoaspartate(D-aspartate) O-methyltransferase
MIDFAAAREAMVDRQIRPSDVTRYPIISAMSDVPREEFVPSALRSVAYLGENVPLAPGRVLLDPRTFAKMLDALGLTGEDLVLDVGCGYGYSAAVIARIAEAVVAVEEDPELAREAEERLGAHGADNAVVHCGPLAAGDAEHGPYDAIIVEGGVGQVPDGLCGQLKEGGRIVALFVEAGLGQARFGVQTPAGVAWRRIFDAAAPILPGFATAKAFEF